MSEKKGHPGVTGPRGQKHETENRGSQSSSGSREPINLSQNSDNAIEGTIHVPGLSLDDVHAYFERKPRVHGKPLTPEDIRLLMTELGDAVDGGWESEGRV